MSTFGFLTVLTVIQFWWIAIWGIAYIVIEFVAGKDKQKEFFCYIFLMIITLFVLRLYPEAMDRL